MKIRMRTSWLLLKGGIGPREFHRTSTAGYREGTSQGSVGLCMRKRQRILTGLSGEWAGRRFVDYSRNTEGMRTVEVRGNTSYRDL